MTVTQYLHTDEKKCLGVFKPGRLFNINDVRNRLNSQGNFMYADQAESAVKSLIRCGYVKVIPAADHKQRGHWALTGLGEARLEALKNG